MESVLQIAKSAKECTSFMAKTKTEDKNDALRGIASALIENRDQIIKENIKDIENSKRRGISESLLDRLELNEERIRKISESIIKVVELKDPVGEIIFGYNLPNGLILKNIRVPLGVIGIIYEARPNVTVDAAVLCLKAGNCVILRGSSHALNTNIKLVEIMQDSLDKNGFPKKVIQIIPSSEREHAVEMMGMRKYIDVLIPRGGKGLIDSVVENSKVPVIETGVGNCHIYIDDKLESIDIKNIAEIVVNAKVQRPSVCNACEKLIINKNIADKILPVVLKALEDNNVVLKGCDSSRTIYPSVGTITEEEWYEEFLSLKIGVKIVDDIDSAIKHINKYGSGHSDTIITSSYQNSLLFTQMVDSSTVYVNASTRFTDGGEFGMGAEMGISTQKLHWRGPMGLGEITTNKFILYGEGQIRE